MKNLIKISVASSAMLLFSCTSTQNSKAIGGDQDKHGCISAAGQSWSELKQNCIQIFNEGKRLNPIEKSTSAEISAFILFNTDESKAELFLPYGKTVIVEKSKNYENGIYKYNKSNATLYVKNIAKYKGQ